MNTISESLKNRTIAYTSKNSKSSRSHTVVKIDIHQIQARDKTLVEKISEINLVDLAGSERVGKTFENQTRFDEGTFINKSLTLLGNVISALYEQQREGKGRFIPYRDSVLTKLLKNSLGGNSKTTMIATVSSSENDYLDTVSTLNYANRVKSIKNVAKINQNPIDYLVKNLREENNQLRNQVLTANLKREKFLKENATLRWKAFQGNTIKKSMLDSESQTVTKSKQSKTARTCNIL